jgi:hypothetical protein
MRWYLMLGVVVLTGSSAQAERVALRGDALKHALAGKTVHLDTPFGVAIPITFQGNGYMYGKADALQYFLGAEADRGRWWVEEGKLCQKWFKWLEAQPSCMSLQQEGQRILWQRDDGLSGTATIEVASSTRGRSRAQALGGPIRSRSRSLIPERQARRCGAREDANGPLLCTVPSSSRRPQWPRPKYVSDLPDGHISTASTANRLVSLVPPRTHLRRPQFDLCPVCFTQTSRRRGPWVRFTAEPSLKAVARLGTLAP